MTNNDDLLKRIDNMSGWLKRRHYKDHKVVEDVSARIRELEAQLAVFMPMENKEGYKPTHVYVPVEPTEAMENAGYGVIGNEARAINCYKCMIKAALKGNG